jgi:quercetin dioxygenase-like cupin family protein
MSGDPEPVVRDSGEVEYEEVDAAEGLSKGVLINDEHGAPNFAIRRFVLESGGEVPKHTNEVEHEQYVIAGEYTVGIEDEQYTVSTGDSLLIPAGVVHWYANDSDEMGEFICVVPNGDDNINLIE